MTQDGPLGQNCAASFSYTEGKSRPLLTGVPVPEYAEAMTCGVRGEDVERPLEPDPPPRPRCAPPRLASPCHSQTHTPPAVSEIESTLPPPRHGMCFVPWRRSCVCSAPRSLLCACAVGHSCAQCSHFVRVTRHAVNMLINGVNHNFQFPNIYSHLIAILIAI